MKFGFTASIFPSCADSQGYGALDTVEAFGAGFDTSGVVATIQPGNSE